MAAPNFWNDQEIAKKIIDEANDLKWKQVAKGVTDRSKAFFMAKARSI